MASLGLLMFFVFHLGFYVANCETSLGKNTPSDDLKDIVAHKLVKLGLAHIESEHTQKHTLIQIVKFQEKKLELQSKYILSLNIGSTNCTTKTTTTTGCVVDNRAISTCEIAYLVNNDGLKLEPEITGLKIVANNCTSSQEFPPPGDNRADDRKVVSANRPDILDLLDESLSKLNPVTNDKNIYILHESLSATEQTLDGAGISWHIHATIILSDCDKNENKDPIECEPLDVPENSPQRCRFEILELSNSKPFHTINITCQGQERYSFTTDDPITGRPRRVDPMNMKIEELLRVVLNHLDVLSFHENKYGITKVLQAFKQIDNGEVYQIKAQIIESTCRRNEDKDGSCDQAPGINDTFRTCYFKISSEPWIPKLEITSDCKEPHVNPHSPEVDVDANSTKVLHLIAESLGRYNLATPHRNLYILAESLKAHRQNLYPEGNISWKIQATIVISDCVKGKKEPNSILCRPLPFARHKLCVFVIRQTPTAITKIDWICD